MPTVFAVHARSSTHLVVKGAVAALPPATLVGHSTSVVEAARVFDTLAPDVVTVDSRLPDGDGIELAVRLLARRPGLGVVLFGPATDRQLRRAVLAGVAAHVPGTAEPASAVAAIRGCLAGRVAFPSRFLTNALRSGPGELSRREREVDALLREGLGATEIAGRLRVTESTVRTYAARVRAKRDAHVGRSRPVTE